MANFDIGDDGGRRLFVSAFIAISGYGHPGRPSLQEREFSHAMPLSLMGVTAASGIFSSLALSSCV
jgi:hypothetical protein